MSGRRFILFSLAGLTGFAVDYAVLSALGHFGMPLLAARLFSFACAVTVTWYLNRRFTFADRSGGWLRQYGRFVSINAVGGLINYGCFAVLILLSPLFTAWPVLAVAAGSLAGLVWNYLGSTHLVFRPTAKE